MATRVVLETDDQGALVVRKTSLSGCRRDRAAEAAWLEHVDHPGVVRLVAHEVDPPAIVTAHAGSLTLRTAGLDPGEAAAALASTARIVADLAEVGLAHGNLTADHVLVHGQQVTLCSPDGSITDPQADLAGLGELIATMIRQWGDQLPKDQAQRWSDLRDQLGDPATQLTARRAAAVLESMASPSAGDPGHTADPPATRRPVAIVAVTLALVTAGLGATQIATPDPPPQAGGPEVVAAGHLVQVGTASDRAAGLDNPCPGEPIAAVLRLPGQQVWTFADLDQEAELVATIPGADQLAVIDDNGCQRLEVQGPAGSILMSSADDLKPGGG